MRRRERVRRRVLSALGLAVALWAAPVLVFAADAAGDGPTGGAAAAPIPGVFEPPEDVEQPDPSRPAGTIAVDLRDADDRPVVGEVVTLGTVMSSVAQGESRRHAQATSDDHGRAVFTGLETVSSAAYRVTAGFQGGSFAAPPFRLDQAKAMHVVLHVYGVTRDLKEALVLAELTVAAEIRDDRIQLEELLNFYNLGRTAWQPADVEMSLPKGFTAFNAQATMSDQSVDAAGASAQLRGTFAPGRHALQFQWQLPWSGDSDVDFTVGVPPHLVVARVVLPVTSGVDLTVDGFPPAQVRHDAQGQRFLVTERRLGPDVPKVAMLVIGLHGLPTPGPGRLVATLLSAGAIAVGLALSLARRSRVVLLGGTTRAQSALLDELEELERARLADQVGPKTYERGYREIIDALARTLSERPAG